MAVGDSQHGSIRAIMIEPSSQCQPINYTAVWPEIIPTTPVVIDRNTILVGDPRSHLTKARVAQGPVTQLMRAD